MPRPTPRARWRGAVLATSAALPRREKTAVTRPPPATHQRHTRPSPARRPGGAGQPGTPRAGPHGADTASSHPQGAAQAAAARGGELGRPAAELLHLGRGRVVGAARVVVAHHLLLGADLRDLLDRVGEVEPRQHVADDQHHPRVRAEGQPGHPAALGGVGRAAGGRGDRDRVAPLGVEWDGVVLAAREVLRGLDVGAEGPVAHLAVLHERARVEGAGERRALAAQHENLAVGAARDAEDVLVVHVLPDAGLGQRRRQLIGRHPGCGLAAEAEGVGLERALVLEPARRVIAGQPRAGQRPGEAEGGGGFRGAHVREPLRGAIAQQPAARAVRVHRLDRGQADPAGVVAAAVGLVDAEGDSRPARAAARARSVGVLVVERVGRPILRRRPGVDHLHGVGAVRRGAVGADEVGVARTGVGLELDVREGVDGAEAALVGVERHVAGVGEAPLELDVPAVGDLHEGEPVLRGLVRVENVHLVARDLDLPAAVARRRLLGRRHRGRQQATAATTSPRQETSHASIKGKRPAFAGRFRGRSDAICDRLEEVLYAWRGVAGEAADDELGEPGAAEQGQGARLVGQAEEDARQQQADGQATVVHRVGAQRQGAAPVRVGAGDAEAGGDHADHDAGQDRGATEPERDRQGDQRGAGGDHQAGTQSGRDSVWPHRPWKVRTQVRHRL